MYTCYINLSSIWYTRSPLFQVCATNKYLIFSCCCCIIMWGIFGHAILTYLPRLLCFTFDPVHVCRNTGIHREKVSATLLMAPAGHTSQNPLPVFFTCQRPTTVSLKQKITDIIVHFAHYFDSHWLQKSTQQIQAGVSYQTLPKPSEYWWIFLEAKSRGIYSPIFTSLRQIIVV